MDSVDTKSKKISCKIAYSAANAWYELDKHVALTVAQNDFLDDIISHVVHKKHNRAFVIEESCIKTSMLRDLIDARIIHITNYRKYFPNLSKKRMVILVLDFGTYSSELEEGKPIRFIIGDSFFENIIFPNYKPSAYDDSIYDLDKERKFRMCYWNNQ